jgi:DNA-binding XRE family transcriptional regulator
VEKGATMDSKLIGQKLRNLRGNKPAESVAKDLEIGTSTIYMWENGERIPRDEMKIKLANYYGVSIEKIFFAN